MNTLARTDWPRFLRAANIALPLLAEDEAALHDGDLAAFRDFLVRAAHVTPREADEVIEWRLLPAYLKARAPDLVPGT